jgi:2-polyprenyl-3-methyl-5-hydroxy-6-metoxy-1,4-benzoquinol methylase
MDLDFFRCLNCRGDVPHVSAEAITCTICGTTYTSKQGIPLFVSDEEKHTEQIKSAQTTKPEWYEEEQAAEKSSPWRHHLKKRRAYVERVLRAHLGANRRAERLLDCGCGDGNNLSWLASYGWRLYGSDYNLLRLLRAKERRTGATLFLADILNYPARDDFFDVIFFNHVIEHIPDDDTALGTVQRILKPGGLLILGTPNEGAWWWQLAYRRAPHVLAKTDHVHFYTARSIVELISAQGLQVHSVEHLGWGPPDWDLDMRLRRYKLLDDIFEWIGRIVVPTQASSLYIVASKMTH